ncbi:hypothetical protein GGI12_000135 [Dipsacomyces acuminosporus]|nr:hypothetical protein GGI12_000135 [Dipsacomyces acuminosporus]
MCIKWNFSLAAAPAMSPGITTSLESIPLGRLYDLMMRPYVPLLVILAYNIVVSVWELGIKKEMAAAALRERQKAKGVATNSSSNSAAQQSHRAQLSSGFKNAIIAHNAVLAVYSIWTFIDYFPAVVRNVQAYGLKDGFCDTKWALWNEKLLAHGFLFYLSKYYELLDTMIILAKGRLAGRLQTFHHSGAIFIMWLGNYLQSPYLSFFVFENSIVHSIMYTYFALTALGFKPPGKRIITRIQISQFYIALAAGFVYLLLPDCQSATQRVFTYWFIPYIIELIRLFNEFARKTYSKPAASHQQPKLAKAE